MAPSHKEMISLVLCWSLDSPLSDTKTDWFSSVRRVPSLRHIFSRRNKEALSRAPKSSQREPFCHLQRLHSFALFPLFAWDGYYLFSRLLVFRPQVGERRLQFLFILARKLNSDRRSTHEWREKISQPIKSTGSHVRLHITRLDEQSCVEGQRTVWQKTRVRWITS